MISHLNLLSLIKQELYCFWSRVPVMLWLLLAYEANEMLYLPPALLSRALSWDGEIRTLNPRINSPLRCHCATSQLNALSSIFTQELCVIVWCKRIDSNYRSHDYQSWALTNYATFTFGRTDEFRTRDLGIKSPLLCQLSYGSKRVEAVTY